MSQQSLRQQARRTAREMAQKRRREQVQREGRIVELAEQVLVALGERDLTRAETERRAGRALETLTEVEGLSVREVIEWCGGDLSAREVARLRRLSIADSERVPPCNPGVTPGGVSGEDSGLYAHRVDESVNS